jgi:hypothetical protein
MRQVISLSIVLIAFDATKVRRLKQALFAATLWRENFDGIGAPILVYYFYDWNTNISNTENKNTIMHDYFFP